MNTPDLLSRACSDILDVWDASAPSTESVSRGVNPNRLRATADAWRMVGHAAIMLVATTTSACFPISYHNRFGFSPEETTTVFIQTSMPAKRRITLAEARRRALDALDLAEDRRRRVRDEEARRWQVLDAIT